MLGALLTSVFLLAAQPARAAAPKFQPDGIPPQQFSADPARPDSPKQYFLAIYSGSTKGVYYYVASTLCEALRARYDEHHIHCVPFRSQGVASNRKLMAQGRAQVALVQSDTNYFAATGETPIAGAYSVVSLHDEMGVLVVGKDSGISAPEQLRQRRVNLGGKETAAHGLWLEYLEALGMKPSDLQPSPPFPQDLNYQGLCGNYIDAFALWSGHPIPALEDAATRCGARVLGMWHPGIENLLEHRKYYFRSTLPANVYPGQTTPIDSYGIRASLIAHEKTDPYIVYWLTRVLIENVDFLREHHPALARLNAREMFSLGNFLPSHPGAERYWREIGWSSGQAPAGASAGAK